MKKAVSLIVVLSVIFNVFGVGALSSRVYADDETTSSGNQLAMVGVDDAAFFGLVCLGGWLSGLFASLSAELLEELPPTVQASINNNAIANGELINIYESGGNKYLVPIDGLDSDNAEFASFICDYMNSRSDLNTILSGFNASNGVHGQVNVSGAIYEDAKTHAVNAFTAYLESKRLSKTMSQLVADGWEPSYNFSFVGPLTPAQMMSTTEWTSTDFEGWHFSTPTIYDGDGMYFPTEASCISHGANYYYLQYANHWFAIYQVGSRCNYSTYVVYNNELFLFPSAAYSSGGDISIGNSISDLSYFVSKSGHHLSDYVSDYHGLVFGFVYTTDTTLNYAVLQSDDLDVSDFEVTTPGATIDQAYKSDEAPVAAAVAAGILPENATLSLDSNGNIVSANGITIEQLESLVDHLSADQIQFEDFEEYLNYITALLMKANVNTGTITDVLNSLRAYEQSQSDALSSINANIKSIADTLTLEGELEKNEAEFSTIIGEHTGLAEANTFVSNWTLVNQLQGLLYNVLNGDRFTNDPPSFRFYWDSDKDGVQEVYTALDLSFLENTLTNTYLEDKDRFKTPLTVREFLQGIMILFCYVSFVINMLRKLSGLVSGGESAASNGLDIAKYDSMNTVSVSRGGIPLNNNNNIPYA